LQGGVEPSTVSETIFRADRLKTMRMRLSAAYKGVNALLMKEGAQDFRLRNELVPINKRHPIAELLDACWQYAECLASRHVTFEYAMLRGVNDSIKHARGLARLLRNRPAKVNLIPFNAFPGTQYECSPEIVIDAFCHELKCAGIVATTRKTRGDDIAAACGQLAGRVEDRTRSRLGAKLPRVASI
jgi:23S rRNA (adenine2503-C2)-methyltransferase